MRSKRLFAILLAFVMVFSTLAPAANAAAPIENTGKPGVIEATKSESSSNGLLLNPQGESHTMRDKYSNAVSEVETTGNNWIFTEKEMDLDLFQLEKSESFAELKAAAEQFEQDEIVAAFVVMESAPLSEKYSSISKPTFGEQENLISAQNKVINMIEKSVLGGEKLEVRYQFTYLTNSFSIRTEFKNLAEIAKLDGVKSVFIMPVYNPCTVEDVMDPNTAASGEMTGVHNVWQNLGYTGTGMTIAIIDTGLDLDHPSFVGNPETNANSMTADDVAAVLENLNSFKYRDGDLSAENLYRSEKVPYAFNYVDNNLFADHSRDSAGDHGSHVAGIAAANKLDTTTVVGMAPDAQIVVMKVFGANGGAYTDDIVAAVEDAMTLGCDVVNASLGSPAGFASSDTEIDLIYERLSQQDIIATFSAGNEGTSSDSNMWGTDLNRTQNPDNASVGSPSTYINTFSIASAENSAVMTDYFKMADGTVIFFQDSIEAIYASAGYAEYQGAVSLKKLAGGAVEYVIVPGLGSPEDVAAVDVAGKVAVIKRGELSFAEKVMNAEAAGSIGVLIWNSNDTDDIFTFGMTTAYPDGSFSSIPSAIITMTDGQKLADAEAKSIEVFEDQASRACAGGQMSTFSSWGPSPSLQLVPEITGIGGNVYSCYDGGTYGLMSGTSMSAPQLAGISALLMQHLQEKYPNQEPGYIRALAEALLMSTADPIISTDSRVEVSPRQQGAGLVNAFKAVTSESYLTVNGGRPKAELGHSPEGVFEFSFEVHNLSNEAKTYTLSGSVLSEDFANGGVAFFMYEMDWALDSTLVFDAESVTVPANGTATVNVSLELIDSDKQILDYVWENGTYVEGFVYLTDEEGAEALSLPYMGFYGDWTDAPVFDTAYWYDNTFHGAPPATGLPEGDEYYHVFWTSLAGTDWVLGMNPYSGAMMGADGKLIYDPAHNSLSPNKDGVLDGIEEIYLSLLRNAKTLTFTYTVDGEVIHQEVITNAPKTQYISSYGQVVPFIHSWYSYEGPYKFAGVESGTTVMLTIDAKVDYADGGEHSIQIPITIDTEGGKLMAVADGYVSGNIPVLEVLVQDNVDVAAVFLMNASGTQIYGEAYDDYNLYPYGNGAYIAQFDVTELGTKFVVAVCDYAGNEVYYEVELQNVEGNLPAMDDTQLYAYRVYDNYIYSDHMYGWVSMNKPASADEFANISVLTDDYLEMYAINAAEYVDGVIFAVDAVYNLVVVTPGLFDRQMVTNLGVNVLDMTFDDSTDTMYVLSKQGSFSYLYSMDLLTGELTELKSFGWYSYGPWAIADDDNGTIYAIKYNNNGIFKMDAANGDFELTAVVDAEGNNVAVFDSNGSAAKPTAHSQSITYSDGKLYWAYFNNNYDVSDLIVIDTETWTSFATPYAAQAYDGEELVDYYPVIEMVGLLTLDETDYQIPASEDATFLGLDITEHILPIGQSLALNAYWLPWNFKLDRSEIVWTSSDESVATVTADGQVLAVGEGSATITASYNGLTATCEITTVDISGTFYAYNYKSGDGNYGHMIGVDLATMDYELVSDLCPVDFYAGDYNGHDGYFYGFDMSGQLFRYDFATNEATALGAALGTYPVDVAYDYSTGLLYALVLDFYTYENTLYAVNMKSGALMELASGAGLMTLACTTDGTLYAMDASGYLNMVTIEDYTEYEMGYMLQVTPIFEESFGDLFMLGSMAWDHNNNVLLWNWCDGATVVWMDVEKNFIYDLGDPSESGVIELTGMFTIPEEIPELADVAVESVTSSDMMIFTGKTKVSTVTVFPFNATSQDVELVAEDSSVVKINGDGSITGLKAGSTTVNAKVNDAISGKTFETSFTVTVVDGVDNLYGHLLGDLVTSDAQAWIELDIGNPGAYKTLAHFDWTIFTQEYYNGKLYTFGYDAMDWEANWQYFVLDAKTYEIVEGPVDMGEAFPYVYDMTYDYATSTMYAVAGASEDDTSLYVVNMETGSLTLLMELEPMIMSIAAGADGVLYAMENSKIEMSEDFWDPWAPAELSNATLWTIDPLACTMTMVGDTGLKSNMIASMAFDHDTNTLYWSALAQEAGYMSNLALVDTETGAATSLGCIGTAGAQVGGLYTICDEYPEEDFSVLHKLLMAKTKASLLVGESKALDFVTMPSKADGEITWTTSDRRVVTVDDDGVITGVSQGKARVTVTVTVNGKTESATCMVSVLNADAGFLTYNVTDGGWAIVNRGDTTLVENLNEGEELPVVKAIASIGTDVYGYDENNQLFKLNTETFERTAIGSALVAEEGFAYFVKDMAYDVKNEQMLVLIDMLMYDPNSDEYAEIEGGCALYSVDLTTGELTELFVFEAYAYVYALAAGSNGEVYFYNTFNDAVNKLDLTTMTVSTVINMQTQSLYGDMYCDYAMYYDELTGNLYVLFTSNGNFYKMHTIDATTGELKQGDYVGEIVEEDWYIGDLFCGLTFASEPIEEHFHSFDKGICECGELDFEAMENPFSDLKEGTYCYEAILWGHSAGIAAGTSETTFEPNANCTRAQIVSFLWRAAGEPLAENRVNPFVDVKEGSYYYEAVLWAVENGITAGTSAVTFEPDAKCTRAQAVSFLFRFCGEEAPEAAEHSFKDLNENAYYYEAVLWAVENGVTAGTSATTFAPELNCTRGQIMAFLFRILY